MTVILGKLQLSHCKDIPCLILFFIFYINYILWQTLQKLFNTHKFKNNFNCSTRVAPYADGGPSAHFRCFNVRGDIYIDYPSVSYRSETGGVEKKKPAASINLSR